MSAPSIRDVIQQHQAELLKLPGVQGVGAVKSRDSKAVCIGVYVTSKQRPAGLPTEIEGYRVEIIHSTGFKATGPD